MNHKRLLYFDIETVTEFKNYQDLQSANKRKSNNFNSRYERRKKASMGEYDNVDHAYNGTGMFFPEYGKVIVFSYGFFNNDEFIIKSLQISNNDEEKLIKEIHKTLEKVTELKLIPAGQNIKGFDIPFLNKKFIQYGLTIPGCFKTLNKKPWEVNFVDTMEIWKGLSWDNSSLDEICELLGLESPKNDINGSDVGDTYWNKNDIERIKKYCERDVMFLPEIVEKIFEANAS